jgi:hypothetical protein
MAVMCSTQKGLVPCKLTGVEMACHINRFVNLCATPWLALQIASVRSVHTLGIMRMYALYGSSLQNVVSVMSDGVRE